MINFATFKFRLFIIISKVVWQEHKDKRFGWVAKW